jgi:uncharacterized protein YjbI with pentapeptide repeats
MTESPYQAPEFHEQDLRGAHFQRVNLREAAFTDVYLNDSRFRDIDMTGAEFRLIRFKDVRMRGVELIDVDIYGEFRNLVINGVDVAPLIEAELNRRMPERAKMRPETADGFREAWTILERRWAETVDQARKLPESALHESVDGEWSFIQTLRHVAFASACWVDRMVLGTVSPWKPGELPWDEAQQGDWFSWDRDARLSLDEALALRAERQATVRELLATLTDEQLARTVSCTEDGHPKEIDMPVKDCLHVLLNEEWEHRLYAERDLAALTSKEQ